MSEQLSMESERGILHTLYTKKLLIEKVKMPRVSLENNFKCVMFNFYFVWFLQLFSYNGFYFCFFSLTCKTLLHSSTYQQTYWLMNGTDLYQELVWWNHSVPFSSVIKPNFDSYYLKNKINGSFFLQNFYQKSLWEQIRLKALTLLKPLNRC